MGYNVAFDSLYTGTLCGKWPEAVVMASLIPLIDARGEINMSYEAIRALTGWPMDMLREGIAQLCAPDPESRSKAEEGRRLVLLDPARPWGWRVVNHAVYREKARLMAKNAREVEEGKNAARLREARAAAATADDRRRPPATASHTHDHTQTHTQRREEQEARESTNSAGDQPPTHTEGRGTPRKPLSEPRRPSQGQVSAEPKLPTPVNARAPGLDVASWERWVSYRQKAGKAIKPVSAEAAARKLAGFGEDQAAVVEQSIAQGWTGLFALRQGEKSTAGMEEGARRFLGVK